MANDRSNRKNYTNIETSLKYNIPIRPEMLVLKEVIGTKKSGEDIFKLRMNKEYWLKRKEEPKNVILDEAHTLINPRRSMSKVNIIMTDWIALIRRILGEDSQSSGELVFITQLPNRIDLIAREMARQIRYHVCHYKKACLNCGSNWFENSEMPEPFKQCPKCFSYELMKSDHKLEIWHFGSIDKYENWRDFKEKTFYKHYLVNDIEKYFPLYDTLQWDNLLSDLY